MVCINCAVLLKQKELKQKELEQKELEQRKLAHRDLALATRADNELMSSAIVVDTLWLAAFKAARKEFTQTLVVLLT
ncbi:MAG: hypothetical protein ACI8VI_001132 [Granulosicoccus sp.]|jgi:hypothetical protein